MSDPFRIGEPRIKGSDATSESANNNTLLEEILRVESTNICEPHLLYQIQGGHLPQRHPRQHIP